MAYFTDTRDGACFTLQTNGASHGVTESALGHVGPDSTLVKGYPTLKRGHDAPETLVHGDGVDLSWSTQPCGVGPRVAYMPLPP